MTRRRARLAHAAAAVPVAVLLAAAPQVSGGAATVTIPRSHHVATPSTAVPRPAGLDTSDRDAVNRAYRGQFAANAGTPIHWTGSNPRCRAGHPSRRAQAATLESLNFVRSLGGLAPVRWSPMLSAKAQRAALIMSANKSLSHTPPRSWKCWSRVGSNAAGHSNLALAFPSITAGGVIGQYMDDMGSSNIFAGHRRWLMNPPATKFGNGSTSTSNALWVLGPTSDERPNPAWVSWPTRGWFPGPRTGRSLVVERRQRPGGLLRRQGARGDPDGCGASCACLAGRGRLRSADPGVGRPEHRLGGHVQGNCSRHQEAGPAAAVRALVHGPPVRAVATALKP